MALKPWRATCIQMVSNVAVDAPDRAAAWAIINANIDRGIAMIEEACASDTPPQLVVLPEFAFQGPPRATPVSQWIEKACATIPGPIADRLAEVAKARNIYIAGNHFEVDPRWPNRFFNSSFLLDPAGKVILRYRRINTASWTSPHDILDDYREAYGEDGIFPVVDTELGRLAIFPCGEIGVPELSRVFMMRGAEVFLHPSNEPISLRAESAKVCRAAENMAYVISTNVAGGIGFSVGGVEQGGCSQIVDFNGNRLVYEQNPAESVAATAMIDIEALRVARRDTGMGNGLLRSRFHMYKDYFQAAEFYPANQLLAAPIEVMGDLKPVLDKALANLSQAGVIS
ncbi:MAG: nitrilase-related carbon-nitrogen hydrolase [Devosia sp.]|nr:nitrilase-related carbon-nitrogen hydrolase [Devosia sp.]